MTTLQNESYIDMMTTGICKTEQNTSFLRYWNWASGASDGWTTGQLDNWTRKSWIPQPPNTNEWPTDSKKVAQFEDNIASVKRIDRSCPNNQPQFIERNLQVGLRIRINVWSKPSSPARNMIEWWGDARCSESDAVFKRQWNALEEMRVDLWCLMNFHLLYIVSIV